MSLLRPGEQNVGLADGFEHQLATRPDSQAILLGTDSLTYRELGDTANWLQQQIESDCAATSGDPSNPVSWCGENHVNLAPLYVSLVRSGRALLLLDPSWPVAQRETLINCFGGGQRLSHTDVLGSCANHTSGDHKESHGTSGPTRSFGHRTFLIGFTSGSTGHPKAFFRTQKSWCETFRHAQREFALSSADRVLAPGPLSHGLSFYAMAETLNFGGVFYGLPRFDAQRCFELIENSEISSLIVVPTMLAAMVDVSKADSELSASARSNSSLKRIVSAGSKLSSGTRSAIRSLFPEASISEYYGASELSFVTVSHDHDETSTDSVGRAFSGVEISIRDEHANELTPGEVGQIHVRSRMLAEGYLEYQQHPLKKIPLDGVDGWKTVGDAGFLDRLGYLYLTDRLDNMLISGGLNVYPGEIERSLEQHPAVVEAVVVGRPDPYWGERICAVIRADNPDKLSAEGLKQHCRLSLSREKIPGDFFLTVQFPLTGSGKIDRQAIKALCTATPPGYESIGGRAPS